jgi:hypothetical protein
MKRLLSLAFATLAWSLAAVAVAVIACHPSWAAEWHPLKAELHGAGFWFPLGTAETRLVPGAAGIWTASKVQAHIRDDILAQDRAAAPECATPSIVNTYVAAPDLIVTHDRGRVSLHSLQVWTVDRCDTEVSYGVEYINALEGQAMRLHYRAKPIVDLFADAGADVSQAALQDASAQRERDRASGDWADLNLPMPPGWRVVVQPSHNGFVNFEYVPPGQTAKDWRSLIRISVVFDPKLTPGEFVAGAVKAFQDACGGDQDALVPTPAAGTSTIPGARALHVCRKAVDKKLIEVVLAKAVAGKRQLYFVQHEWRVPAGDRAAVLKSLEAELAAAERMLDEVRVCNPVADPAGCPSPFFL